MDRIKKFPYAALLTVILFLGGCAGTVKNMQEVPESSIKTAPSEGKAMVVFLRPSGRAYSWSASIFEIKGNQPEIIGIIAAKKKIAYEVNPGKHTFMVVSESADFMTADLLPNKTYYALVTPRAGVINARFSLKAVHNAEANSATLNKWLNACKWVSKNSDSYKWATSNSTDIQAKFAKNYTKWVSKPANKQPHLLPQDGR